VSCVSVTAVVATKGHHFFLFSPRLYVGYSLLYIVIVGIVSSLSSRLESPTRSLYMEAPKGIQILAEAGDIQATCRSDLRLESKDGEVGDPFSQLLSFHLSILLP
jgi:hypothetical protein